MLAGRPIATLVLFILSMIFVIRPISIGRVPVNFLTAPIVIIAILWAAGCLGPKEIRDGIVGTEGIKPYNILLLFLSLAYMAISLDFTGVLQSAAFAVANKGGASGRKTYAMFYIMLLFLGIIMGNDAVILSGTVFLVYYTKVAELSPMAWLLAEFAAANTASMVPSTASQKFKFIYLVHRCYL
jgi:Na+/H+ antiporter NhaD/arsenite permease-like protein